MKKKKILGLVLAASMVVGSLTACGTKTPEAPAETEVSAEETEASEEVEETATETGVAELTMSQLDAEPLKAVQEAIDSQYAYDFIYKCSKLGNDGNELGFRNAGSTGELAARDIIKAEMEAIGLQDVEELPFDVDTWEFTDAGLTTSDGTEMELSSFGGSVGLENDLTADLVWLNGGMAADYEGVDVEGKIVLVEIDNMLGYWYSAPQYEAEIHGAKAIIFSTRSELNNVDDDGMITFDGCLRTTIPALSISKNNCAALVENIEAGDTQVTLKADMTVEPGTSYNLIGYIPGKDPSHVISIGAHYDGWYHTFQDDLYGVGMFLSIAKAMVETGYQPEYTLAFIAFGSEEYGVADTVFDDWCIGAWNIVTTHHPEWIGKNLAHFEMDSIRPDTDTYTLNVTPELQGFFEAYLAELDMDSLPAQFVNEPAMKEWAGPWSQDYSFTRSGIPGVASKQGTTAWKVRCYHTQFDDETAWNEDLFKFHANEFTQWIYTFNKMALVPLDFSRITADIKAGLDTAVIEGTETEAAYVAAVDAVEAAAKDYYEKVKTVNQLYLELVKSGASEEELAEVKAAIDVEFANEMAAYKVIEDQLVGMDEFQTVCYRDQYVSWNWADLTSAKEALEAGDVSAAISAMYGVDTTYLVDFSREVYEYVGITGINDSKQWAQDKTVKILNTYDVMEALFAKSGEEGEDLSDVIGMVDELMQEEAEIAEGVYTDATAQLNSVADMLGNSTIDSVIELLQK